MSFFSNFKEFYQKSLLPIGESDQIFLEKEFYEPETPSSTHWLFALEGEEIVPDSKVLHWKVLVYPATDNHHINFETPFYVSTFFHSIHKAYDYAKTLETMARQDLLTSKLGTEKKRWPNL